MSLPVDPAESSTATARSRWPNVELPSPLAPRPEISHVLFDFDGTLSLIRQGWPEVMVPMFVEVMPRLPGEAEDDLRQFVLDDIMRLTGKQTIYQMIQLAERIRERGGEPREPLWYKHEYLRRLEQRIGGRAAGLRSGEIQPDELLVHAVRPLLEHLQRRGLHALSGQRHRRSRRPAARRSCSMSPAISARTFTGPKTTTGSSPRNW